MSSFDDLGRALRDDAAANAPRASVIDVDAVAHAARARRRPRQWTVGTLSVVAALGMGGLALQAVTPPTLIAASESADTATVESAGGADVLSQPQAPETLGDGERSVTLLACGATAPEPSSFRGVTLSVDVPQSARMADGDLMGVATIANSSSDTVSISAPAGASGSLAQGGVIVAESLDASGVEQPIELGAGDRLDLPLRVSTVGCEGEALAAGGYSVVVALEVVMASTGEAGVLIATAPAVRLD